MHIAIDDTYGPETNSGSAFVTGSRRTHVAVIFPDQDVPQYRLEIAGCLKEIETLTGIAATEFHFVDIYNRKSPWDKLPNQANLALFKFFASIYHRYKWRVIIQTIDARTLQDHGIEKIVGRIDGLDLSDGADLSLLWLLTKIKGEFKQSPEPISLILDEGRRKPGVMFGSEFFHDWPQPYQGVYSSSVAEPLLQIADFIAFCVNRSAHLAMKAQRTEIDTWFLNLVGKMQINCADLKLAVLPKTFSVADFDAAHVADRISKGLPCPNPSANSDAA